jgi:hypothetical protein
MKNVVNPGVLAVICIAVFVVGVPSAGWTNIASAEVEGRGRAPWDCRPEYPLVGRQTSKSVGEADTSRSATLTADSQSSSGRCDQPNRFVRSGSEQSAATGDDQGAAMAACSQVAAFPAPVPWRAGLVP